jgi:hypothetical protein
MKKFVPIFVLLGSTLLLLFFYGWQTAQLVNAQCGTASSCNTCHQTQSQFPVNTKGAWHIDHANYDLCADCHKGNAAASDQTAAHTGKTKNLSDMVLSCQNCHPDDFNKFYAKYATQLGVSATPQIPVQDPLSGLSSALCVTPAAVNPNGNPSNSAGSGNLIVIIILVVSLLAGGGLVFWNEKRRKKSIKEEK